ncbi:MAG: hypothetical protein ACSW8F_04925 [bacterium]
MTSKLHLAVRDITWQAVFAAMLIGGKEAMASLPNIEPVTMLIIAGTLVFGLKMLASVGAFVLAEGLLYGFGFWFPCYCYMWPLLVIVTWLFRKEEGRVFWAALAGFFGLSFGFFFELPFLFIIGFKATLAYYISGIPFDIVHAAGNFVLTFLLLPPILSVLRRLESGRIH